MTLIDNDNSAVCIVGVGASTAIGRTAAASAAAIRAGIAGFGDHPYMIDRVGDPFVIAMAPYLRPEIQGEARFIELARAAANDTLSWVSASLQAPTKMTAIVGLPEQRPGLPPGLAAKLQASITRGLSDGFRVSNVQLIPNGHSSGLMAIQAGCREVHSGASIFALVGGVDSYIDVDTLEWLDKCEHLHIPTNAWGFIPGEAAGFCLLCSAETAARYDLDVLARVSATATAQEPNRIYTETVCIGEGLTSAVRQVLESMPPDTLIDTAICDQNGEAYRADECGFMLARTSENFMDVTDFLSPADCWGDVGAASGPLFASLAVFATRKGYANGPNTLLWTSSDGGDRSAALLETNLVPTGST